MQSMNGIMSGILERAARPEPIRPGDTVRDDGIIICGQCGEPKTAIIDWFPDASGKTPKRTVCVSCACKRAEEAKRREEQARIDYQVHIDRLYGEYGIPDPAARKFRFEQDDGNNQTASRICRAYVNGWTEMLEGGIGMILYGAKGTGKSFFAACIVNAVLEHRVTAAMSSTARIMNVLDNARDRQAVIDHLQRYKLLALDDLGAERQTDFATEKIFSVIDARYRSGLPLIVTTNLDLREMREEKDIERGRIYDRVLEMCPIAVKVDGTSRRTTIAEERKRMAFEVMRRAQAASGK